MLSPLKAEFRKLLTARSTYLLTGGVLALITFLSVFVFGYKQAAQKASSSIFMSDTIYAMLGTFVTFGAIVAILLVAHEYRYSTINYTLTLSRSRLRVLLAKVMTMLTYATIVGVLVIAIAYVGARIGLDIRGATLAPQTLPVDLVWKYLAYLWSYALVGIILATLIRGLVGSIVAFFLIPTAEGMLSLLLKENTKYLPFRSMDAIPVTVAPNSITAGTEMLAAGAALGMACIYLGVFGVIATVSFVKRDAS